MEGPWEVLALLWVWCCSCALVKPCSVCHPAWPAAKLFSPLLLGKCWATTREQMWLQILPVALSVSPDLQQKWGILITLSSPKAESESLLLGAPGCRCDVTPGAGIGLNSVSLCGWRELGSFRGEGFVPTGCFCAGEGSGTPRSCRWPEFSLTPWLV